MGWDGEEGEEEEEEEDWEGLHTWLILLPAGVSSSLSCMSSVPPL